MTNILKRLSLLGLSAAITFSISSCNGGDDRVADEGVYEEEVVAYEDDKLLEKETELVTVANEGFYETWDLDNDGLIEETEWEEGWNLYLPDEDYDANLYTEWDLDDNEFLDEDEFIGGLYGYYDADDDGIMNEDDFTEFTTTYYYDTWDLDVNNEIAENEFEEGWNTYMTGYEYNADLFTEWDVDGDGILEDEEFGTGMFDYWDADDSGFIEETEYTTYYTL